MHQAVGVPADAARAGQARRADRHRRVGRPHGRRHAQRPAGHPDERSVGRGERGGRPVYRGSSAASSTAASSSARGAGRRRPTLWWSTTICSRPTSRSARRRTTGRRPRSSRPIARLVLDEAHHLEDVAAEPPRHPGDQPCRCGGSWRGSSGTAAGWRPRSRSELVGRGDLLSRASLDLLHERLLPAHRRRPSRQRCALPAPLRAAGRRPGRPAAPGRRFRLGRDLGRRASASSSTRRSARFARSGSRWRPSPTGWPNRRRPSGAADPAGAAGGDPPARMRVSDGLNRTLRPAGGGDRRPCAGWSGRSEASSVGLSRRAARPGARCCGSCCSTASTRSSSPAPRWPPAASSRSWNRDWV